MRAAQTIRRYLHQPKAILSSENPFSAPDRAHGPSRSRQRVGTGLVLLCKPTLLRWFAACIRSSSLRRECMACLGANPNGPEQRVYRCAACDHLEWGN